MLDWNKLRNDILASSSEFLVIQLSEDDYKFEEFNVYRII